MEYVFILLTGLHIRSPQFPRTFWLQCLQVSQVPRAMNFAFIRASAALSQMRGPISSNFDLGYLLYTGSGVSLVIIFVLIFLNHLELNNKITPPLLVLQYQMVHHALQRQFGMLPIILPGPAASITYNPSHHNHPQHGEKL